MTSEFAFCSEFQTCHFFCRLVKRNTNLRNMTITQVRGSIYCPGITVSKSLLAIIAGPMTIVLSDCNRRPPQSERTTTEHSARLRSSEETELWCPPSQKSPLESDEDVLTVAKRNLGSSSQNTQLIAIDRLAATGSKSAVQVLATFIQGLPAGEFRDDAVRRASMSRDKQSLPALLNLLQSSEDPGIIRVAHEVFSQIADADAVQSVLDLYDNSTDEVLRQRLQKTIALAKSEEAIDPLRTVLSDMQTPAMDGMVRASAQALCQIGTQPAVDALISRLDSDENEESRGIIAAQVQEIRNPVAESSLRNASLGNTKFATSVITRLTTIRALLNHPSAETQETLLSLSSDPNLEIATAAANVLAEIRRRLAN